jgi:hypothetical protein
MSLAVDEPWPATTTSLAVAGDLSIDALVALANPDSDRLHGLTSGQPVGDLDAVVLAQVAAADRPVDELHAASFDEPQRTAAGRHANSQ